VWIAGCSTRPMVRVRLSALIVLVIGSAAAFMACGGATSATDSQDGGAVPQQAAQPCGSTMCPAPQWCVYPPGPDYYVEGGSAPAPECVDLDPKCDPHAPVTPHELMRACCTQQNTTLACNAHVGDAGTRVLYCQNGFC
jgi:hypothetical protein